MFFWKTFYTFSICVTRYSDDTIYALEKFDEDEKIDLELILALIRHIVLNDEVSSVFHLGLLTTVVLNQILKEFILAQM